MTKLTLTMPRLGETMEEGLIVGWLVAEGQSFRRGDPVLELESDKTAVEFPALGEGVITRFLVAAGDRVQVGAPVAEAEVASAAEWKEASLEAATAPAATADTDLRAPSLPLDAAQPVTDPQARPRATPLARRLARDAGIDLASLQGSGRRGRIERGDVEAAAPVTRDDLCYLATPQGRLAYKDIGTGDRTFLLIHGFSGDHTAWTVIASALARAGNRVIIPDLPGHGATGIAAENPDSLSDALIPLLASLTGPISLVGHSLGAAVAVDLAARHTAQIRDLMLLTPAGCGPQIGADFVHGMAEATSAGEVAHLLRLLGPKGGAISDKAIAAMAETMAEGRLKSLASQIASPSGRQKIDILRPLAGLSQPVTALFGTMDQVVPASDAQNLPLNVAARFIATGHMPQWDAPKEVTALILESGSG